MSDSKKKDKIIIFDTSLRDGEQAAGASMSVADKLLIADKLDAMKVDIIEAGFAASSVSSFKVIDAVCKRVKHAKVASLARAIKSDIEAAADALKASSNKRIHTFISTSDIHLEYQLKKSREEVLDMIKSSVGLARNHVDDVEWSAMDATRSDRSFLYKTIETAINAGATTINLPDTVGYTIPDEYKQLFHDVRNNVVNIDKAVLSVHCHNDLGLAVANTLSSLDAGVRQIECTINGLGERAGNSALEEIVMMLHVRSDVLPYYTDIDMSKIYDISREFVRASGIDVQKNKAIVGENAFCHESGIHQDGFLKNPSTYEIMSAETIGLKPKSLSLGKLSGSSAFLNKLTELGINCSDEERAVYFKRFKALADTKKHVYDKDILNLIDYKPTNQKRCLNLLSLNSQLDTEKGLVHSLVKVIDVSTQKAHEGTSTSATVILSIFNAINNIVLDKTFDLVSYNIKTFKEGIDAEGEVKVVIRDEAGYLYSAYACNLDILVASANAYLNAINKMS